MYELTFNDDEKGRERFDFLYQAWMLGFQGAKGPDALTAVVRMQDQFEAASIDTGVPILGQGDGPTRRQLVPGGGSVTADDRALRMLIAAFDNVPWTVAVARVAQAVREWLVSHQGTEAVTR